VQRYESRISDDGQRESTSLLVLSFSSLNVFHTETNRTKLDHQLSRPRQSSIYRLSITHLLMHQKGWAEPRRTKRRLFYGLGGKLLNCLIECTVDGQPGLQVFNGLVLSVDKHRGDVGVAVCKVPHLNVK